MNLQVFLIDDDNPSSKKSKWARLDAFVTLLNEKYEGNVFSRGQHNGTLHDDRLSQDAHAILGILKDPASLILLDVRMQSAQNKKAAELLWQSASVDALDTECWETIDNTKGSDSMLAGAVITLARHYGSRIAWVTTNTAGPQDQRNANLADLAPQLPWDPNMWNQVVVSTKLDRLINGHYLNRLAPYREMWTSFADAAQQQIWEVGGECSELFPTAKMQRFHDLHNILGHFATCLPHSNVLKLNALFIGTMLEHYADSERHRLEVVKSSTRTQQIPVFLIFELLGVISSVCNDNEAITWDGRWQASDMVWALNTIGECLKEFKGEPCFKLEVVQISHTVVITITLRGEERIVHSTQTDLQKGAAKRAAERNGSPGSLTLALDVLDPVWTLTEDRGESQLKIQKTFELGPKL